MKIIVVSLVLAAGVLISGCSLLGNASSQVTCSADEVIAIVAEHLFSQGTGEGIEEYVKGIVPHLEASPKGAGEWEVYYRDPETGRKRVVFDVLEETGEVEAAGLSGRQIMLALQWMGAGIPEL